MTVKWFAKSHFFLDFIFFPACEKECYWSFMFDSI